MEPFLDSDKDSLALTRNHFLRAISFPVFAVLLMWLAHAYRLMAGLDPADYGVVPRSMFGVRGILSAPLVHGSLAHIASNTIPFVVLGGLTFYFYQRVALRAFWLIYFLTGILVWLFARPVSHIGASGVVYGLVAFIFWNGIARGSRRSIFLSLLVLFFYSGMFVGVLPNEEGVSWESHLLGSISGIFAAFWFRTELEEEELARPDPFADERNQPKQRFLPVGIFNMTKAERIAEMERLAELARIAEMQRLAELQRLAEAQYWAEQERLRQEQQQRYPPFWNQSNTW